MRALVPLIIFLGVCPAFGQQPQKLVNSVGLRLVLIPAGSFTMGSPEEEADRYPNETPHKVTISKSFYLGSV